MEWRALGPRGPMRTLLGAQPPIGPQMRAKPRARTSAGRGVQAVLHGEVENVTQDGVMPQVWGGGIKEADPVRGVMGYGRCRGAMDVGVRGGWEEQSGRKGGEGQVVKVQNEDTPGRPTPSIKTSSYPDGEVAKLVL